MKTRTHLLFALAATIFCNSVSAQLNNGASVNNPQNKFDQQINHYFERGKKQKKIAWILLGGGMVLNAASSGLVANSSGNTSGYEFLSSIGSLATTASIPLFFSASGNKNKGQLVYFEKNVAMASSDSLKKVYLEDAVEYFSAKARGNTTTAIIFSAVGGAFIVAGIAQAGSDNYSFLFSNELATLLLVASGISFGVASIPFYIRGSHLKRTANAILRTGRIPKADFSSISTSQYGGQFVALGIRISL